MAPRPPTGRAALLQQLRSPQLAQALPLCIGSPTRQVGVTCEAGTWRLRRVVLDEARFQALVAAQQAQGKPVYPEHADACRLPTGELLAEAPDLDAFCQALERLDWPRDW